MSETLARGISALVELEEHHAFFRITLAARWAATHASMNDCLVKSAGVRRPSRATVAA